MEDRSSLVVQEQPKSPEAIPDKLSDVVQNEETSPSPKPLSELPHESVVVKSKPVEVESKPLKSVKIPSKVQSTAVTNLKATQITKAMSSIVAATLPKPKPSLVHTTKPAPVIMKRKLKTNSSIINVPFQHKFTGNIASKTSHSKSSFHSNNIPSTSSSTSATIVSLESVIKPVPKVIIHLGQSSTEDSDTDSDTDENDTNEPESAIASPSHINEYNDVSVPSPTTASGNEIVQNTSKNLPKVDATFEVKLDEFLKQARAKTENLSPTGKSVKTSAKVVRKIVQKTPSVRILCKDL